MVFSTRLRIALLSVVVIGAATITWFEFTDWHQLEAVTLDDENVIEWETQTGFSAGSSLLDQPVADIAATLLEDRATAKVDIEYDLPGRLHIKTNHFVPEAFVLDKSSGRMHGLNRDGRVVPLAPSHDNWEHPVMTGVEVGGLFQYCDDARVVTVMPQLEKLANDNLDLYRLIEEIDLGTSEFVTVRISGLPYQLRTDAGSLYDQVSGFIRFMERFQPDLSDAKQFDLRFANMIVQESRGN
ncbi:MAG: hypothetical protein DRP45_06455 [Candidatus Zixiibacteriota bacterium]|nr:MAG: hypothetical protein DRP45_06455 [candidate division Zixibacteria bacterium]